MYHLNCYIPSLPKEAPADWVRKFNKDKISDEISSVLLNNEPRISNILVSVSNPSDTHELNATIQYDITGISAPSQAVDVVLFPARV